MMRFIVVFAAVALSLGQAIAQANPDDTGGTGSGGDQGSGSDSGTGPGSGSGSDVPKPDPKKTFDDLEEKTSDFDKLKTPASPAFTILGVAPTEIQRPSTPKAVALALGQFVSGANLVVPTNFALEVSPFWLFHHPDLTLEKYQSEDALRPLRTFSISVATTQTIRSEVDAMGTSTNHTDSDVAVGARSVLYQSEFSRTCIKAVEAYGIAMAETVELTPAEIKDLQGKYGKGTPEFKKQAKALQQSKIDNAKNDLLTSPKCITDGTLVRGVTVDVAGALDWLAQDSKLTSEATSWHRAGAWVDAAYDSSEVGIAGMLRFAAEHDMKTQQVVDVGGRGFFKGHNYAVSLEALARYRLDTDTDAWTYKVDIAGEYEVTEGTWLSVSFGKDFVFTPGNVGALFTLANLQWNLGTPQIGK
jgi:hypothetical protein